MDSTTIFIAEFIGTALLLTLGNGVVANQLLGRTKGNGTGWMLITTGWGLAVGLAALSVGRISGAHLNPAVTIGLWSIGELDTTLVPIYLIAEMLGAITGAVLVWAAYYSHWNETESPDDKLATFCTGPAVRSSIPNFFCEFLGTAVLLFGILAMGANAGHMIGENFDLSLAYKSGLLPFYVGILVWAIGMGLGGPTGYAINPARDLGPRIAHAFLPIPGKRDADWEYAWIPVAGPIAGGVAGAWLFVFLDGFVVVAS